MTALPEMRFLARCFPYGAIPIAHDDSAPLDWKRLVDLAGWHGMFPLFSSRLLSSSSQNQTEVPPAWVVSTLRAHQISYLQRSLSQTAALVELQQEFDRIGITVVSWKGPSLGLLLYGSATLRESADLDFLFLEEDLQEVVQTTRRLGYRMLGSSQSESKDMYILTLQREFTFARSADEPVIEFHLQILPSRFSLWQDSQDDIRRSSALCTLGHVELRMQSPEDLLASLCAHATKHNWDRLKWACDIAQFLRVYGAQIPWTEHLLRLRKSRKDAAVLLGLALAANLFELELAFAVLEALDRAPKVLSLANALATHLMSGSLTPLTTRQLKALVAVLCPRLRDRLAYILRPIVELNYEDLYVPVHNRLLFFMNYAFRVVRLLRKYGAHRLATKTVGSVRSVR